MYKILLDRNDAKFPEQLKEIRKSLKLNTFNFSLKCRLSRATIRRIENPLLKDFIVPNQMTWDKINLFLNSINYFKSSDENKFNLLRKKELENYQNQYKSIWQPVSSYTQH